VRSTHLINPIESDNMNNKKLKILIMIDYYWPGYKSGGPLRTIINMVARLNDVFDFYIITRDRDFGDKVPYVNVKRDTWNKVDHAQVYYLNSEELFLHIIWRLLKDTPHDILYLNSYFSPLFTVFPLLLRLLGFYRKHPVVIAPRGEFSPGALALKPWKKNCYIWISKLFCLYEGLTWQASSQEEAKLIKTKLGSVASKVQVASDLLFQQAVSKDLASSYIKDDKVLRLVFLSRIARNKNLDFLLNVLSGVESSVNLCIYGPIEDQTYWKECKEYLSQLPENVMLNYSGTIHPEEVTTVFANNDLFVFPTRGENFGHVIIESLSAGTPVMISDQTPWQPDDRGAVQVLPLVVDRWREAIEAWARLDVEEVKKRRVAALGYASSCMTSEKALEQNRELFSKC